VAVVGLAVGLVCEAVAAVVIEDGQEKLEAVAVDKIGAVGFVTAPAVVVELELAVEVGSLNLSMKAELPVAIEVALVVKGDLVAPFVVEIERNAAARASFVVVVLSVVEVVAFVGTAEGQ